MGFFGSITHFAGGVVKGATHAVENASHSVQTIAKAVGPLTKLIPPSVLTSALNNTPLGPFAGTIGALATGDLKGVEKGLVTSGVSALVQATPLGDVPVLNTLATNEAASLVNNAIGLGGGPSQSAMLTGAASQALNTLGAAAITSAANALGSSKTAMSAISALNTVATGGIPAAQQSRRPAPTNPSQVATALAAADPSVHPGIKKPYGKTFPTREQWEVFASRPETNGGTIGFPK